MGEERSCDSIIGNGLRHYWPCGGPWEKGSLEPLGCGSRGVGVESQGKEGAGEQALCVPSVTCKGQQR